VLTIVLHTFLELRAKVTLIILLAISALVLLGVALSLSASETAEGVTLMIFGNPLGQPVPADAIATLVAQIQTTLAGGLMTGVFVFGIIATASLIPDALEKGTVDMYLSRPMWRWELLLGKHLGATAVLGATIVAFMGGLWIVVGVRVGYWNHALMLAALLITLVFLCLYALVVFLAVLSRSTPVAILGAFLYYFIVDTVLYNREGTLYLISENGVYRGMLDGLSYILPQVSAMQASIAQVIAQGTPGWEPLVQGVLSAAVWFTAGAILFARQDL
jgi:ABC-type transport system involved in multi-copper enzyme maturation permease subunit